MVVGADIIGEALIVGVMTGSFASSFSHFDAPSMRHRHLECEAPRKLTSWTRLCGIPIQHTEWFGVGSFRERTDVYYLPVHPIDLRMIRKA